MQQPNSLLNINQIATAHSVSRDFAVAALKHAKVEPLYSLPAGRGQMHLYEPSAAQSAVTEYRRLTETAPPPAPAAATSLPGAEILGAIEALDEKLAFHLERASEQNVQLFRAMQTMATNVDTMLKAMAANVDTLLKAAAAPAPVVPPPVVVEPPPAKQKHDPAPSTSERPALTRVAIIGLLPNQQQLIEKEFRDAFDLRFYASDEAKGRAFENALANCTHVIAMTNFINHGIEAAIRASRSKLIRIAGGMSTLRDRLTALYVEVHA